MWLSLGRPSPRHYKASLLLVLLALVIRGKDQATQIAIAATEGAGVGRCWLCSCSSGRCPISRVKKALMPLLVGSGLQNVETVWAAANGTHWCDPSGLGAHQVSAAEAWQMPGIVPAGMWRSGLDAGCKAVGKHSR